MASARYTAKAQTAASWPRHPTSIRVRRCVDHVDHWSAAYFTWQARVTAANIPRTQWQHN